MWHKSWHGAPCPSLLTKQSVSQPSKYWEVAICSFVQVGSLHPPNKKRWVPLDFIMPLPFKKTKKKAVPTCSNNLELPIQHHAWRGACRTSRVVPGASVKPTAWQASQVQFRKVSSAPPGFLRNWIKRSSKSLYEYTRLNQKPLQFLSKYHGKFFERKTYTEPPWSKDTPQEWSNSIFLVSRRLRHKMLLGLKRQRPGPLANWSVPQVARPANSSELISSHQHAWTVRKSMWTYSIMPKIKAMVKRLMWIYKHQWIWFVCMSWPILWITIELNGMKWTIQSWFWSQPRHRPRGEVSAVGVAYWGQLPPTLKVTVR